MNSSQRIAAQRYAAAYDALSQTAQQAADRAGQLSVAAEALAPVQDLLNAPEIALLQKKEAVQAALKEDPSVASFVQVLLEAKRYNLLPAIVQQVRALADRRQGIMRARVFSARELSAEQQSRTEQALSARYGATVKASFQMDKTLLGGLKIWCGTELIDGSLQGQLLRLEEELTK